MKVIHYPRNTGNPYQRLLCRGLSANEIECSYFNGGILKFVKFSLLGRGDVLHLHWIHGLVLSGSIPVVLIRLAFFYLGLLVWRLRLKRLVWTVHNLENHRRVRVALEFWHARIVSKFCTSITVHGISAVNIVADKFGVRRNKLFVVPHGNYDGAIRMIRSLSIRDRSEGTKFLFFGKVRFYKGVVELLEAFQSLPGPHQLRVLGEVRPEGLKTECESIAARDSRVELEFRLFSDSELADALEACDVVVLPFRDVFTSGSLLMALTAGRCVVASRSGLIPEYVDSDSAFLFDPSESGALLRALKKAVADPNLPLKGVVCRKVADQYDWKTMGRRLLEAYRN